MNKRYVSVSGVLILWALALAAPARTETTRPAQAPAPKPSAAPPPATPPAPVTPSQTPAKPPSATNEEELADLVVMIHGKLAGSPVAGAGIILGLRSDRLYIVTANHVVREAGLGAEDTRAEGVEVQLHWLRGEWQPAIVLDSFDRNLDVAVLAVPGASRLAVPALPWASLVRPETLAAAEKVVPIGYPSGLSWFVPRQAHVISSVGSDIIRTEGDLVPGHSGGALVTGDWGIAGVVRSMGSVLGEASRIDVVVRQVRDWGYPIDAAFRERAATSEPAGDASAVLARDRQDAEGLVSRWIAATLARDVPALVGLAETPFYFDQEVLVRREDLASRLQQLFAQRTEAPTWKIQSIRAITVGELKAQGQDAQRDRVLNSLSMNDADWRVAVTLSIPGRAGTEGVAFFVRKINGVMKMVGTWD